MGRRAIAISLGVLALAGCSSSGTGESAVRASGQAAVATEFQLSQDEVNVEVGQVLTGLGQPPGEPPAGLASATTARMVLNRLVDGYAEGKGLEPTGAEVEAGLEGLATQSGGAEALNQRALESGIPVEALEELVRTNLLVTAIGQQLDAAGDSTAQLEAARVALTEYSASVDVEVAPRYGTWDDSTLTIVPGSSVAAPDQEQATE